MQCYPGCAQFIGSKCVSVNGHLVGARYILIATDEKPTDMNLDEAVSPQETSCAQVHALAYRESRVCPSTIIICSTFSLSNHININDKIVCYLG